MNPAEMFTQMSEELDRLINLSNSLLSERDEARNVARRMRHLFSRHSARTCIYHFDTDLPNEYEWLKEENEWLR